MIVTYEELYSMGACAHDLAKFKDEFGDRVKVTHDVLVKAYDVGIEVSWWCNQVFESFELMSVSLNRHEVYAKSNMAWGQYQTNPTPENLENYRKVNEEDGRNFTRLKATAIMELVDARDAKAFALEAGL